ncbi:MAG TPA: choice-of-anchor tandem repeat GloVer-containing protein, partial [Humisphaera sp.]|nr:choice-of-anchor tandem repeat GloVer-containing protein [Humisphaera sp.]
MLSGYAETVLASFGGMNGAAPYFGGVVMDSAGNLFGISTVSSGSNQDFIFETQKGSSTITTLAGFNETVGQNPYGGLAIDSEGNLYGTADGGSFGDVFELAKGSSVLTVLASFSGIDGEYPESGVIIDSFGNLYGTTNRGYAVDSTVFEIAKNSSVIATLATFTAADDVNGTGVSMDSSGNL